MFFFDKRSALKQARKVIASELKLGVPEKPVKSNAQYKFFGKNIHLNVASAFYYEVRDEYAFSFRFEYHKNKYINFQITANGLDLTFTPNGMRMIKEQYPDYEFLFDKSRTYMTINKVPVNSVKEVSAVVSRLVQKWNNSGLYALLLELYKV